MENKAEVFSTAREQFIVVSKSMRTKIKKCQARLEKKDSLR